MTSFLISYAPFIVILVSIAASFWLAGNDKAAKEQE